MSDPIRNSLTYLRDHTVEEAIRNNRLPTTPRGWTTSRTSRENDSSARINTFVMGVLERGVTHLEDADIAALRQVYTYPHLSTDQKYPIFQVCLRMFLKNISPESREREVTKIGSSINPIIRPYLLQTLERLPLTASCILEALALIPPSDHTEETLSVLVSLFQGVSQRNLQSRIVQAIENFPMDQRGAAVSYTSRLTVGSDGEMRLSILTSFLNLPKNERHAAFTRISRLIVGAQETSDLLFLFWTIHEIPESQRDSIISSALPLMEQTSHLGTRKSICDIIRFLPEAQRSAFVSSARPLIEGITNHDQQLEILYIFKDFPEAQRQALISFARPFMEGVTDGQQRVKILLTIKNLSEAQRNELTSFARPLLAAITEGQQRMHILYIIARLPTEHFTEENRRTLRSFIQTIPSYLRELIISKIDFFPPLIRISAINLLLRAQQTGILSHSDILTLLFDNDPSLRAACYDYLQNELSTNTDAGFVYSLCEQIIDSQHELMLDSEHPVFQAAITAMALSNSIAVSSSKNPFTIHKKLKALETAPMAIHPFFEATNGKIFSVSTKPLVDKEKEIKNATTFSQLPREITANTLRDLFRSLDQRLERLSSDAKEQASGEINSQCDEASYEALRTGMLEDPYLRTLLQTTGPTSARVPLEVMQLFTILQFVLSQPNVAEQGQILTKREEVLIKMANSIRACSAGKKEGIFITYNLIKGQSNTILSSSKEQAKEYLYPIIYRLLTTLLSEDTPLMKALTGTTTQVDQLAHQAIYLKNLIGTRVGLTWDLAFDQHTGVLYDALVEKKPEEVLKIFFYYFSPRVLIKELLAQVNRDLSGMSSSNRIEREKANALYNLLYGLLDDASYWNDEDENGNIAISLTTEGSIKLLATFGYIQESDALQVLDRMTSEAGDVQTLRMLIDALVVKDSSLQYALFGRMYWHHVKTGKKHVEHLDYGRAAFLGTDPRIVVTTEEKQEVIRQVQIEHVLHALRNSPENEFFIKKLEQIDRNTIHRLYGKMFAALQRADKHRDFDYFGGGEAAFKKKEELREEKIAAIDSLALELETEWIPVR